MARLDMPALLRAKPEYGDACAETDSVHRGAGVWILPESVLSLTGEDRTGFLHSVSSNDIKSLPPFQGCETLMLTSKGKIIFPFSVLASPDRLDVMASDELLPEIKSTIESSLIMEDVAVSDRGEERRFFHLAGPRLAELLKELNLLSPTAEEFSWNESDGISLIRRRRSLETGVDVGVPAAAASEWFEKISAAARALGGGPVGSIAQDILRIESANPKFGVDFTSDNFPQEAALEERAVSFTKGCYTGQETVARIKTYGGVTRRLVGLVVNGPVPAPGDKLFRDGVESGRVTSAARSLKFSKSVALASAHKSVATDGATVSVSSPDGDTARVVDIARAAHWVESCRNN